jgi:AraC family transcriptional regulator, arabinose operon regulatory protein
MDNRSPTGSRLEGRREILVPERVLKAALREQPLLRGLLIAGAGYSPKATGQFHRRPQSLDQALLIYCVKGGGWCELAGQLHTVRAGDLLLLPPDVPYTCGAHAANPWTIHWAGALGANLPEYLNELGVSVRAPLVWMGEDLQLARLFNEVLQTLENGSSFLDLLQASHALAHLLAMSIRHRHEHTRDASDVVEKVAQAIIYMSEHLDQPLRVSALAALANLSQAHFSVLFKQQTGCSPRDYLHLLRIHGACQLLRGSTLNVKEIAFKLGYQDQFHFSRQFKAFQGLSPSEYRERKLSQPAQGYGRSAQEKQPI